MSAALDDTECYSLSKDEAVALIERATEKQNCNDFKGAMEYYFRILTYAKETGSKQLEGASYSGIGNAHGSLGNNRESLMFVHQLQLFALGMIMRWETIGLLANQGLMKK